MKFSVETTDGRTPTCVTYDWPGVKCEHDAVVLAKRAVRQWNRTKPSGFLARMVLRVRFLGIAPMIPAVQPRHTWQTCGPDVREGRYTVEPVCCCVCGMLAHRRSDGSVLIRLGQSVYCRGLI